MNYKDDVQPILSCTTKKTVKNCLSRIDDEIKNSNLTVSKVYYKYSIGQVELDQVRKVIGYNDFLLSIRDQVQEHLDFLNNKEAKILDTIEIQKIKDELGINKKDDD